MPPFIWVLVAIMVVVFAVTVALAYRHDRRQD